MICQQFFLFTSLYKKNFYANLNTHLYHVKINEDKVYLLTTVSKLKIFTVSSY